MIKSLSWSELYLFRKSKEEWKKKYIDGIKEEPTPEMEVGKIVHNALEHKDYDYIPALKERGIPKKKILNIQKALAKTPRGESREVAMRAEAGEVPLFSVFDGFDRRNKTLIEYKTVSDNDYWNQRMVDTNLQLSFYALVYWLNFHSYFREIILYRLHLGKGTVRKFETARGYRDLEYVNNVIKDVHYQIVKMGLWERRAASNPNQQSLFKDEISR